MFLYYFILNQIKPNQSVKISLGWIESRHFQFEYYFQNFNIGGFNLKFEKTITYMSIITPVTNKQNSCNVLSLIFI